jgi:hypothetical protein
VLGSFHSHGDTLSSRADVFGRISYVGRCIQEQAFARNDPTTQGGRSPNP